MSHRPDDFCDRRGFGHHLSVCVSRRAGIARHCSCAAATGEDHLGHRFLQPAEHIGALVFQLRWHRLTAAMALACLPRGPGATQAGKRGHERQFVLVRMLQPTLHVRTHHHLQPLDRRRYVQARTRHVPIEPREVAVAHRAQQRVLVSEVPVQQRRGHAGVGSDAAHRGGVNAGACEQRAGNVDDLLPSGIGADALPRRGCRRLGGFVAGACHRCCRSNVDARGRVSTGAAFLELRVA